MRYVPWPQDTVSAAAHRSKHSEFHPSPATTLERLTQHVEALLKTAHSGVELKDLLVEGDVALSMGLGMKGLIVSTSLI